MLGRKVNVMFNQANERKFHVYKREANGRVVRIGAVVAVNKVQADTRARMVFGRILAEHETVWAVDPEGEKEETRSVRASG
jgi:uncharacterized protein (DUF2236 family)